MSQVNYVEEVLFEAPLPPFLNDFKTIVLQAIVPRLQSAIQYVIKLQYAQQDSIVITLLTCIVILQFFRAVLVIMVKEDPVQIIPKSDENVVREVRGLQKQVENLKKEISRLLQLQQQTMLKQAQFDSVMDNACEFAKKAYGCANQRVDKLVEKTLSSLVGIIKLFKNTDKKVKNQGEPVAISLIPTQENTVKYQVKDVIASKSMIQQTELINSVQREEKVESNGEEIVDEKDNPLTNLSSHLSEPTMKKTAKTFRPPPPLPRGNAPPPPPRIAKKQ